MTDPSHHNPAKTPQIEDWRFAIVALCSVLASLAVVFGSTIASMVAIWMRSDTYAHGFFVLPIVGWLIWRRKELLRESLPEPDVRALPVLFGLGFGWLFGVLIDALVIQQLVLVLIVISAVWAMLGARLIRLIAFPLGFLIFAVPMGESLVPFLMEVTATFTVGMLKLSGLPVYREGLFFSLPSGNWSVVEACSGVRYLIVSVMLGTLFAYLSYQRPGKRLIFVGVSVVVPVLANGLRAYFIVIIGHLSDMKLATGVDHLIYGWLFFGIVMFILFSIGILWRDSDEMPAGAQTLTLASQPRTAFKPRKIIAVATTVVVLTTMWPLYARVITGSNIDAMVRVEATPDPAPGWHKQQPNTWLWSPVATVNDGEIKQVYSNGTDVVALYVDMYVRQTQGKELINSENSLTKSNDDEWRLVSESQRQIFLGERPVAVYQSLIKGEPHTVVVWYWYRVGARYTSNPYVAKLLGGWARLTLQRQDASRILLATSTDSTPQAEATLQVFLNDMLPNVESTLDAVVGGSME